MIKRGIVAIAFLFFISSLSFVYAIPAPASTYCIEQGYKLENGKCVFANGESCPEWEFFRGECGQENAKKLKCAKAGEKAGVSIECCSGLKALDTTYPKENGDCEQIIGSYPTCSNCGDNVCDTWENKCNCPVDCGSIFQKILNWLKNLFGFD